MNIDISELNKFIDENMRNRKNGTNYNLLKYISLRMSNEIKLKDRKESEIITQISKEKMIDIGLEFFQSIDQELYEKVKRIVDGDKNIEFNVYYYNDIKDFTKERPDGFKEYSERGCLITQEDRSVIYLPLYGTIQDLYIFVHEMSHIFDLPEDDNPTRNILGEVTPNCFERMLGVFLIEHTKPSKQLYDDIQQREKEYIISQIEDTLETLIKILLVEAKNEKGEITEEILEDLMKNHSSNEQQSNYILKRLMESPLEIDYRARYMIGQLVYPYFFENYKKDRTNSIENLKQYFQAVKDGDFEKSLMHMGISLDDQNMSMLIDKNNQRIEEIMSNNNPNISTTEKETYDIEI